eukprot:1106027-Pelagomonas_calceolata.AAC.1
MPPGSRPLTPPGPMPVPSPPNKVPSPRPPPNPPMPPVSLPPPPPTAGAGQAYQVRKMYHCCDTEQVQ